VSWEFEILDGPYGGTCEGPAWDGSALLFTHIPASRIMRYDPQTGSTTVYRENTNSSNGTVFDPQGILHACEGGGRRIVRLEPDGGTKVLADSFEGLKLNQPNDLAIDLEGRVWFTDPFFEDAVWSTFKERSSGDLDHESVFRTEEGPDGSWSVHRATFDTTKPNGILFSLDHQSLYVAQSARAADEPRELRSYPVNGDGSLGEYTVLHDFGAYRGIDGMVLDTGGNIVATAGFRQGGPGPMIYVFSPSGEVLEQHPTPVDRPTNCTFGDPDLKTLYVTTSEGYLLRAYTERQGRLHYPAPA